ncbi:MFS transporter [Acutalibacter intestini]|uniref:MFS transporter n=1 Tax=Acutalibacter intestini TaxID=3093659 RepID=UPI002AC97DE1|nr:MFS transporter [Acutalibacter sp. M00204]
MKQKSNFPKFMLLWAGELISAIGGGLTSFGLGVYVFGQTGSAASMALITLLAFLPTLLLSVPAGVLADRYDRRLLMMLGIGETICASGMLVSSLYLGAKGIRRGYVKTLCLSLLAAGVSIVGFGIWENIYPVCLFGFLFFAALPFANNCLDYLVRVNIPDELQGRAWGLIGFLSQIGYVVAYGGAGALADGIAARFQIGVGRGAAWVVMAAGVLLGLTAAVLYLPKSVRGLEKEAPC